MKKQSQTLKLSLKSYSKNKDPQAKPRKLCLLLAKFARALTKTLRLIDILKAKIIRKYINIKLYDH
ncbi:hypothetical protein BpHYR1_004080 [Brachionus plicatilis]|uniref:Uncharacterized protein n=1 Tax=Brachionus plicatilis TaxID=10195 RepID=A0A3M7PSD0_BRAPC|nr:hypothetical protein BpHYR1_004080 [Brachionus plicatilis]